MRHRWLYSERRGMRRNRHGDVLLARAHMEEQHGKLEPVLCCQVGSHALRFFTSRQFNGPFNGVIVAAVIAACTHTLEPLHECGDAWGGDCGMPIEHIYFLS